MKNCKGRNKKCDKTFSSSCNLEKRQCYIDKSSSNSIFFERFAGVEGVKRLSELSIGQSAQILCSGCERGAYRRRLLDMGMTRGTIVKIKKIAPLGDPINIEVRGYELCLRKCDISNILVKVL